MPGGALDVDGQVAGAAADVADHHAHLALGLRQHQLAGGQGGQHPAVHRNAGRLDTLLQVAQRGGGGGHQVSLHLQPIAVHADGRAHPVLPVHHVAARHHVHHLPVEGDGDRAGRFQGTGDVLVADGPPGDPRHPLAVDRHDLRAGQADQRRVDLVARGALGLVLGALDSPRQRLQVHHPALAHPGRRGDAGAQHAHPALLVQVAHQGTDLGSADVQAYEDSFVGCQYRCQVLTSCTGSRARTGLPR